tara:strand:+ start:314 stop:685 length:372 start_codon:yes stop_codon:yes gene_type:complete
MKDLENNLEAESETKEEETTPEAPSEAPEFVTSEIVDLEWEQLEEIFNTKQVQDNLNSQLASMLIQYERAKLQLIVQLQRVEDTLNHQGAVLKDSCNIAPELTYELRLPSTAGEKGFFVRKDP